ncbi:hypothetical protein [Actinomadura latina]|uniref:Uncharacterized protein n=1 Tax=Actinomadura latina TaxID=163603 RepID=A0A846Z743_9ACTN|nr:hypothetical protein [Actinomadura latina]NKZ07627.1 hypothetical protein [Actinomadura latina]
MDSEDRTLGVTARGSRADGPERGATSAASAASAAARQRETDDYACQVMVSSARAHERAAALLEEMATAHPEEAELHLQSAARHRRWAANDRELARQYAPQGGPDGP